MSFSVQIDADTKCIDFHEHQMAWLCLEGDSFKGLAHPF